MQNTTTSRPILAAGLLTLATTASAAIRVPIPLPCPSDFVDTESSVDVPLNGWREDTRRFHFTLEASLTPTNAIQLAFGTDANGSETLEPEETDVVIGVDCGEPFARDERVDAAASPRLMEEAISPLTRQAPLIAIASRLPSVGGYSASTGEITIFDLSRVFDRNWNLVRVTTRNLPTNAVASIVATFRNNPTLLILR